MESTGFQGLLARGTEWAASGKVTLPAPSAGGGRWELPSYWSAAAKYEANRVPGQFAGGRKGHRGLLHQPDRTPGHGPAIGGPPLIQRHTRREEVLLLATIDRRFRRAGACASRRSFRTRTWPIMRAWRWSGFPAMNPWAPSGTPCRTPPAPNGSGVISSLGVRSDPRVIPDLSAVAKGKDAAAAAAAITALGQMGGLEAFRALSKLESGLPASLVPPCTRRSCVVRTPWFRSESKREAEPVLEKLPPPVRHPHSARRRSSSGLRPWDGRPAAEILAALKGNDAVLRQAALQALKSADLVGSGLPPRKTWAAWPRNSRSGVLAILAEMTRRRAHCRTS